MQKIINQILRDNNVIDTGISKRIHETLDPMIQSTIHRELNLAEMASKAMEGLLANNSSEIIGMENSDIAKHAIGCAMELLTQLDKMRGSGNAH